MVGECEHCGKISTKLELMLYNNDDNKLLCPNCWNYEADRGDYLYEIWREDNV